MVELFIVFIIGLLLGINLSRVPSIELLKRVNFRVFGVYNYKSINNKKPEKVMIKKKYGIFVTVISLETNKEWDTSIFKLKPIKTNKINNNDTTN